jgi:hypothetical protein
MIDREEIDRRFEEALISVGLMKVAEAEDFDTMEDNEEVDALEGVEDESVIHEKATPSLTLNGIFQHPDAHPYVLDLALLKKYGPEWMEWEPEALELRIPQDFPTRGISSLNMEKVQAVKTLHYVDTFWKSWEVFVPCVSALNALYPDFTVMQVPTVAQCAVAVDIATRVRGDVTWSDELKAYMEAVYKFDDMYCTIPPLDFVTIDTDNTFVDYDDVMAKWPEVRRKRKAPIEVTVTAEQLRHLLWVQEALDENSTRLRAQLPLLLHE